MILPVVSRLENEKINYARVQFPSRYIGTLRSAIGYYTPWVPDDRELDDFYRFLENDWAVKHASQVIALLSSGQFIEISGKNKDWNLAVSMALENVERLHHSLKSLVEKSIIFGIAVQKKEWEKVTWEEFPGMVWTVPSRLVEVDRRRIRIERGESRTDLYWTIWDLQLDSYVILEDKRRVPGAYLAVQDYIWHWFEREETSGYYRGLGEVLYAIVYMKSKIIQYWGSLAEKWGRPFVVATIEAARAAYNAASEVPGSVDVKQIMSAWLDLLEDMQARNVACMADHDKIQVHEAGSQGNNLLHELLGYLDHSIEMVILLAELTTTAPSVGSYAMGQLHQGVTDAGVLYNRNGLEETAKRQLVYDFYLRNRWNFARLGIRKYPRYHLRIKSFKEELREELLKKTGATKKELERQGIV